MDAQGKPPRAWAAELIDAWISRQPTAPIVDQIPDKYRGIATMHARASCELIRYWGRVAATNGTASVPRKLKPAVTRYLYHREL